MTSDELAQYLEATNGVGKSWFLVQLRLSKLQDQKPNLTPEQYADALADIHQDLMNLGEWWLGQEPEVFGKLDEAI